MNLSENDGLYSKPLIIQTLPYSEIGFRFNKCAKLPSVKCFVFIIVFVYSNAKSKLLGGYVVNILSD